VRELEAGASPRYGDQYETNARQDVIARLDALEDAIQKLQSPPIGIGHNGPPEDEARGGELSEGQRAEVTTAAKEIREELLKPSPDALKVGRATLVLRELGKWLASKLNHAVDKAIDFTVAAGMLYGSTHLSQVLGALNGVVSTTVNWLHAVTLPF
jgi:hypothetical protein